MAKTKRTLKTGSVVVIRIERMNYGNHYFALEKTKGPKEPQVAELRGEG